MHPCLFPPAHRWKYARCNTKTMPLHHLDALLSSNTPVEFVSKYCRIVWAPLHPCNSNRSDFYAAQITSYTPTLKSRRLRRQGFQSGVRGPPTGQCAASRWTQARFSSSFWRSFLLSLLFLHFSSYSVCTVMQNWAKTWKTLRGKSDKIHLCKLKSPRTSFFLPLTLKIALL